MFERFHSKIIQTVGHSVFMFIFRQKNPPNFRNFGFRMKFTHCFFISQPILKSCDIHMTYFWARWSPTLLSTTKMSTSVWRNFCNAVLLIVIWSNGKVITKDPNWRRFLSTLPANQVGCSNFWLQSKVDKLDPNWHSYCWELIIIDIFLLTVMKLV